MSDMKRAPNVALRKPRSRTGLRMIQVRAASGASVSRSESPMMGSSIGRLVNARQESGARGAQTVSFEQNTDILSEGEQSRCGYIPEAGWLARYRMLGDGRRQIVDVVLPGDAVGFSVRPSEAAPYSVMTLCDCVIQAVPLSEVGRLQSRDPSVRRAFENLNLRSVAILQERIIDIGRRTARERLGHLLLEFMFRLRAVGMCEISGYALPLTQESLADILGLSIVHVNRTLHALTDEGLIEYRPGWVGIRDEAQLVAMCEFDDRYLHAGAPA